MSRRIKSRALAAIVLTLLAAGCTTPPAATTPSSAPPATTETPADSGVIPNDPYAAVESLKMAAVASGYPCPNWQQDDEPVPEHAKESGSCSDEDVFSIYADAEAVAKQRAIGEGLINMLVGPNWIVNVPESHRHQLQLGIGGEHVPGSIDNLETPEPEPTKAAPWRPDQEVDWENHAPVVKKRIDKMGKNEDCEGLQEEFDTAYENDSAQRNRTGDGNADLLDYIDEWMQHAGCY